MGFSIIGFDLYAYTNSDMKRQEVRYEDGDNCGREYPHVYGRINNDAVMTVLPFIKDKDGVWHKNPEFSNIQDK